MESTIVNEYYVAEIGRTVYDSRPIYANISYGDEYSIEDASKWEDEELLVCDMEKFLPEKQYILRHVEDNTTRVIK